MSKSARVAAGAHRGRRAWRRPTALVVCALVLTLTACASRPGAAISPSPTESSLASTSSPTPEPQPSETPSAIPTDPALPDPSPTAEGTAKATIVNSGADGRAVYASGLVTGEVASGGVCTLTAVSGDTILTAEIEAQSTPAALNCGLIEIAASPGDWSLTLTYRAESSTVASEPVTVRQS